MYDIRVRVPWRSWIFYAWILNLSFVNKK